MGEVLITCGYFIGILFIAAIVFSVSAWMVSGIISLIPEKWFSGFIRVSEKVSAAKSKLQRKLEIKISGTKNYLAFFKRAWLS
jgi:hypothetical protein